jgi:putative transposase
MSTSYPSNLSDAEWECLQRHLPPLPKRGRPPTDPLQTIFDAIFYVLRDFLPVALSTRELSPLANCVLPFSPFARCPGTWCASAYDQARD